MTGLIKRLRNSRGESLVEVLVSVLVGSLALLLLASLIAVSARITKRTEQNDAPYYAALNAAEGHIIFNEDGTTTAATGISGTVTVSGGTGPETFSVEYFGGEDIWSYQRTP